MLINAFIKGRISQESNADKQSNMTSTVLIFSKSVVFTSSLFIYLHVRNYNLICTHQFSKFLLHRYKVRVSALEISL